MSYFWMHSRKLLTWSILACSSIIAIPRALFKMSSSNCVSCSADSTSSGTVSVLYEDAREGLLAAKSSRLLHVARGASIQSIQSLQTKSHTVSAVMKINDRQSESFFLFKTKRSYSERNDRQKVVNPKTQCKP
jgi:hypothetical protein